MSLGVWVFAYGSLIFRPDFPFCERRAARLHGFARRFWQRSPDHRGTPAAPGRVVTLIEEPGTDVLGVAYRITPDSARAVLAELDLRERAGYEREQVEIEFNEAPFGSAYAFMYRARRGNPDFSDDLSTREVAEIASTARGPSGDNASYVRQLAQALRDLGEVDPHVFEIERLLLESSQK
ncbi:MAG TPA: gamma-glutamylcyclotransferase [Polyangiaceae bacterium]|nr:gamma-glutamylcyclotransferase [Polyangiaceae bacterium]